MKNLKVMAFSHEAIDGNNRVRLLKKENGFRWLKTNGKILKKELQSWESKGQMMWITFVNDGWESQWFKLEHQDGTQVHWDEELSNTIMDLARDFFGNEQFGIANTSQMLMGNAMRDNL